MAGIEAARWKIKGAGCFGFMLGRGEQELRRKTLHLCMFSFVVRGQGGSLVRRFVCEVGRKCTSGPTSSCFLLSMPSRRKSKSATWLHEIVSNHPQQTGASTRYFHLTHTGHSNSFFIQHTEHDVSHTVN